MQHLYEPDEHLSSILIAALVACPHIVEEPSRTSYTILSQSCAVSHCAGLKIPKFDVTEHVKKVDTEFDPLLKSASELEAFSQKRSKEIQEEIKQIDLEIVSCCSTLNQRRAACLASMMALHAAM